MPKAKSVAKKAKPAAKKGPSSKKKVAPRSAPKSKAAASPKKAAEKKPARLVKVVAAKPAPKATAPVKAPAAKPVKGAGKKAASSGGQSHAPAKRDATPFAGPLPDRPSPRATKLPSLGAVLNKRDMEWLLTAGQGRGVEGEGSLKGRLSVRGGFPYLHVVGRDKRELVFLLQGPDQEVLPAYVEHKVSVSGLIRKTTNYGGTVDVRKYAAKKPDVAAEPPPPVDTKPKYLSPGEVEQLCSPGMGAGLRGFAALRGSLEMTGEQFFLVVSNAGTRQQVSFLLQGKTDKSLKKMVGQTVLVQGICQKNSGWGGIIQTESCELRPSEFRAMSRDGMEITSVEGGSGERSVELKVNQGLSVRLQEKAGFTWAIEPMLAKRVVLREANFELRDAGATREFFFTPRTPGQFEVDFFLAKAFAPSQVSKTFKLNVAVRP